MPVTISAEPADSADARALIGELEAHLEPLYPAVSRHGYSVEKLLREKVTFFLIREDGHPVGCGGVQLFGSEYAELKRMYVRPAFRGQGFAKQLLEHLSAYAQKHGLAILRLETGIHQHAAIKLYEEMGFMQIAPFGPYRPDPLSRCYEKRLV